MTLYSDFQHAHPLEDGLPEDAWDISDRISYCIGYTEYLCLRSLVLHLKDLQDQIFKLEQKLNTEGCQPS